MTVNEYLKLPYHYVFQKVGKNWLIEIQEVPACYGSGETLQKAYIDILKGLKLWIETALERNLEIPLPEEEK
jgi:predicted RNase H-like HicB family nuclease